jgi:hypothetical protein
MKEYNPAELKAAVADLNAVLESAGSAKIKIVAQKTTNIATAFHEAIVKFIEAGTEGTLPDSVVDFYNMYLAEEETEETTEVVPETKPAPKAKPTAKGKTVVKVKPTAKVAAKTAGKTVPVAKTGIKTVVKTAGKTVPVAKTVKKDGKKDGKSHGRSRDGNGLVAVAVEAYQTLNLRDTKSLREHLAKLFPDRNIASTVSHVVCILGHVKNI